MAAGPPVKGPPAPARPLRPDYGGMDRLDGVERVLVAVTMVCVVALLALALGLLAWGLWELLMLAPLPLIAGCVGLALALRAAWLTAPAIVEWMSRL